MYCWGVITFSFLNRSFEAFLEKVFMNVPDFARHTNNAVLFFGKLTSPHSASCSVNSFNGCFQVPAYSKRQKTVSNAFFTWDVYKTSERSLMDTNDFPPLRCYKIFPPNWVDCNATRLICTWSVFQTVERNDTIL